MDVPAKRPNATTDSESPEPTELVTLHETRPGRVVFTECGNVDGWIATDGAVDLEP